MPLSVPLGATLTIALFASLAALGCPGTLADKECFVQEDRARIVLARLGTQASDAPG